MSLALLVDHLRRQSGLLAKRDIRPAASVFNHLPFCLLYTSDAADEEDSVDLGGRRIINKWGPCLLYTSPSPRDATLSRMPSSA